MKDYSIKLYHWSQFQKTIQPVTLLHLQEQLTFRWEALKVFPIHITRVHISIFRIENKNKDTGTMLTFKSPTPQNCQTHPSNSSAVLPVLPLCCLCNFIEITLRHGCSPVNLLHIFRIPFLKNTSGQLLLEIKMIESDAQGLVQLKEKLRATSQVLPRIKSSTGTFLRSNTTHL